MCLTSSQSWSNSEKWIKQKGKIMLKSVLFWPGPVWTWLGCSLWCWYAGRGSGFSHTGHRRCLWRRCWPSWAHGCRWWPHRLRRQTGTRLKSPVPVAHPACAAARSRAPRVWQWLVLRGQWVWKVSSAHTAGLSFKGNMLKLSTLSNFQKKTVLGC